MARTPATFKQTDIVRAVKAARAAGLDVAGFELGLDGRTIKILERGQQPEIPATPFDQWKASRDARSAQRH